MKNPEYLILFGGVLHFFNIFNFDRMRKKGRLSASTDMPPVIAK